jgi:hypothetical protein
MSNSFCGGDGMKAPRPGRDAVMHVRKRALDLQGAKC